MPTIQIDGNDAIAVYNAIKEARAYIEKGHGPIFVEAFTYRWEGHSMSDAGRYRSPQEVDMWKSKDPIERMKKILIDRYEMSEDDINKLDKKAQDVVDEAIEFAIESPEPDVDELFDNIFVERI